MSRHMCPLPTAPPCCTLQVPEVLLWDTLQGVGAVQNLRKYSHPPSAKWAPFPAAWLGHPSTEAPPLPAQHSLPNSVPSRLGGHQSPALCLPCSKLIPGSTLNLRSLKTQEDLGTLEGLEWLHQVTHWPFKPSPPSLGVGVTGDSW